MGIWDVQEIAGAKERLAGLPDPLAFLGGIFAKAPFGLHVFTRDGQSLVFNDAFRQLFGSVPPPEYNLFRDEIAASLGIVPLIQRAFAGEVVDIPTIWYDARDLGHVHVAEARRVAISITCFPLNVGPDGAEHIVMMYRDDTEKELAREVLQLSQEALVLSEARYRAQFEVAPEAITTMDLETGLYVEANERAAQLFGRTRVDLLTHGPIELSPVRQPSGELSIEAGARYIARALEGEVVTFDWTHEHVSGSPVPVEIRLVTLPSGPGQRLLRASLIDVSQRRLAETLRARARELEQENRRVHEASRMKSEFLANMSHELRTPLNAIIGFAELLVDGKVPVASPQHHEFLDDILSSGRHLLQLINDILDLAKVEAGKLDLRPEPVRLSRLVGEVVALLRTQAAARRVKISAVEDASVEHAVLDPARFRQVLFNYLSNAIKFTGEGGAVAVRTLAVPNDTTLFRLEVQDTGIGIAREDVDRLFVDFEQLDAGASKRHGGTGLGLALTRRLVEAQGGRVGVESSLGLGSTFFALLPRRSLARVATPSINRAMTVEGRAILVVDDDPRNLRLMEAALGQLGYLPITRRSAEGALAAAADIRPVAMIIDLLMPETYGFELIEKLRALPMHADTPILLWTVKDLSAEELTVARTLTQGVLPKGIAFEQSLLAELASILAPYSKKVTDHAR
jgi:PAS domain S-box-containing protein